MTWSRASLRPLRYLFANLAVKDFFDQVNIKHFNRKDRKEIPQRTQRKLGRDNTTLATNLWSASL